MQEQELVTAAVLEVKGILKKGTAYKMVAAGKLPHFRVGPRGKGVRFSVSEVIGTLRRPVREMDK